MSGWRVTNTGLESGGKTLRRPAGLTDYGWRKHAEAVCVELNAGATAVSARTELSRDSSSWSVWNGGSNPAGALPVQVILRSGVSNRGPAEGYRWEHLQSSGDIVFWRLALPETSPAGHFRPWGGGAWTSLHELPVRTVLRNGQTGVRPAHQWRWEHRGTAGGIVFWQEAQ